MQDRSDDRPSGQGAERPAYVYDSHQGIVVSKGEAGARPDRRPPSADRPAVDIDSLFDAVQQAYEVQGIAGIYYDVDETTGGLEVTFVESPSAAAPGDAVPYESLQALLDAAAIDSDDLASALDGVTEDFKSGG